jgi:hypothetical protein
MTNEEFIKTLDLEPKDMSNTDCYLLKADGTKVKVLPAKGSTFNLEELQSFVGGYIEPIFMGNTMFITNENGRNLGLPYNDGATKIYRKYYKTNDVNRFLVGDVLLCPSNMMQ